MLPTAGLYQHALLLPGIQEPALWSIPAESAQNVHEILQSLPPGVRNHRIKCCAPSLCWVRHWTSKDIKSSPQGSAKSFIVISVVN